MSENDRGKITTDLVIKLFDTLKESNNDLKTNIDKQTDAIVHLSSLLKEGVTMDELKSLIDDHHKDSGTHLDSIDTCTETIEDNSGKILKLMSQMVKKINTMILVVLVAFSLMAVSYLFVSDSVETIVKNKIDDMQIEETLLETYDNKDLRKEIEKLRKEIEGLR